LFLSIQPLYCKIRFTGQHASQNAIDLRASLNSNPQIQTGSYSYQTLPYPRGTLTIFPNGTSVDTITFATGSTNYEYFHSNRRLSLAGPDKSACDSRERGQTANARRRAPIIEFLNSSVHALIRMISKSLSPDLRFTGDGTVANFGFDRTSKTSFRDGGPKLLQTENSAGKGATLTIIWTITATSASSGNYTLANFNFLRDVSGPAARITEVPTNTATVGQQQHDTDGPTSAPRPNSHTA